MDICMHSNVSGTVPEAGAAARHPTGMVSHDIRTAHARTHTNTHTHTHKHTHTHRHTHTHTHAHTHAHTVDTQDQTSNHEA